MNEAEKTIEFCKGQIKQLKKSRKNLPFEKFDQNKCNNLTKKIYRFELMLESLELLKLKEQGKVIITPCAVGDYVRTKYDDDLMRVDGFTTYGDDLKVWCEEVGIERYTEFELSEIEEFIPREKLI
jgi:prefoldin subunit 5